MKLYTFWGSSTAYRVRIALALKGLSYTSVPVDLTQNQQNDPGYAQINPGRGVPALVLEDGTVLAQSMAILEYLEEAHPSPPLLPRDAVARARVRAAAMVIASEVHPVNNLRIRNRLKELGHGQDAIVTWMNGWMAKGFDAYERMIEPDAAFSFGDAPDLADICLIPQVYNAHRWGLDLGPLPRIAAIEKRCLALPAFAAAYPDTQPDAKRG